MTKRLLKKILYNFNVWITSFFDFRNYWILSRKLRWPSLSDKAGIQGNYCYGNSLALKNALKADFDSHCMIEHGIYFGRKVLEDECIYPEISTIYTFSPYRKEVLQEHFGKDFGKKIVTVGPYLIYAKHMMSEKKRRELKKKFGRVLLVFPSHSSPEGITTFNYDEWLSEIGKRSKDYDTVIISLFWLDIYNGNYKRYKDKGYVFACCGNRFDPNFLSRQKDLISLADMTMSNDIGTHIGYCIAMRKPHYIYHQEVKFESGKCENRNEDINNVILKREYCELYNIFSEFKEQLTPGQEKIVKYYWGEY